MTDASLLGLVGRLVVSLAVVLSLMAAAAWILRRRGGTFLRGGKASVIEVLARQSLTRTSSVQIVRLGERAIVLGVTDQSVTYLTEGDPAEYAGSVAMGVTALETEGSGDDRTASSRGATRTSTARMGLIESLRDRTTRR